MGIEYICRTIQCSAMRAFILVQRQNSKSGLIHAIKVTLTVLAIVPKAKIDFTEENVRFDLIKRSPSENFCVWYTSDLHSIVLFDVCKYNALKLGKTVKGVRAKNSLYFQFSLNKKNFNQHFGKKRYRMRKKLICV